MDAQMYRQLNLKLSLENIVYKKSCTKKANRQIYRKRLKTDRTIIKIDRL